jgi:glycyl-tRNA synthetase beta subunit
MTQDCENCEIKSAEIKRLHRVSEKKDIKIRKTIDNLKDLQDMWLITDSIPYNDVQKIIQNLENIIG